LAGSVVVMNFSNSSWKSPKVRSKSTQKDRTFKDYT
jgi:hypothetical protein